MDVRELLELERALQGHGIVDASPEVEDTPRVREHASLLEEGRLDGEGVLHQTGEPDEMVEETLRVHRAQRPSRHAPVGGQEGEGEDLSGESLGRGDADLGADQGEQRVVGLPDHRGGRHVADRQRSHALPPDAPERREGVGGLSRLRDREEERALRQQSGAPSKFRSVVHADGDARQSLDEIAAEEPRVP